jgi:plastocyanin
VDVAVAVQGQKSFSPNVVVINVGDSVRWNFLSDGHNVVSGSSCVADNRFCSPGDTNCGFAPNAVPGELYTHVFSSAGTFNYFCSPHCADGMTGTVIVQAGSSATPTPTPTPGASTLQFSSANYSVGEADQLVTVTITRSGDSSGGASVNYATSDSAGSQACSVVNGFASSRCDYISALGTLRFAAGETSKAITILIVNDSYQEGPETFNVSLSNPTGASLGSPSMATVTINDNPGNGANPIDQPSFFVTEHYYDFLNRLPDSGGLAFWTNEITSCGSDQTCIQLKRINVSAAYFLSIEFQQTGYLVERMYKAAYGSASGTSTLGGTHQLPVPIVRFIEFLPDTQEIGQGVVVGQTGWETVLENNKQAFALEYAQRSRFTSAFPTTMTPTQFVDAMFTNAGVTPSATDRTAAISEFGSAADISDAAARGRALRDVAENSILNSQEFNRAFVLMQFFGYLRRNPNDPQDTDYTGYEFWLNKLNQFNGDFVAAEMVKAFITSAEYRQRFGP